MKKFILFIRLYWLRILIALILISLFLAAAIFLIYGMNNYLSLEPWTRKQIAGQMAMMVPMFFFAQLFTIPFYFAMHYFLIQGGGMGKIDIQKAKVNVKWEEVIGLEEAKKEAWELVKLLKDRALLKSVGGKIIKGTLMLGPPGCGKTYLAKAIASECGLPLLPTVGSEFVGMFVGQGTARMKSLFKQARALAKMEGGCIIFIDEIDSFARPRMPETGFGGRMSMNATINQFLTEMDGLRNTENNIVVIAATNVGEHELDPAIMRAGRFDRKIHVRRPNLKEREQIFKLYLSKVKYTPSINVNVLARKTVNFSPAEIESMVREAGLICRRHGRDTVNMKDLSDAYERVAFGQKSNIIMSKEEKIWTAYHETGHAFLYYMIHPTDDVMKATIIPRRGTLGYVFARAEEERHSGDYKLLMSEIKVGIAGYVAEKIKFGYTSDGVGSDFEKAMKLAQTMVWTLGMGPSGIIGSHNPAYLSEQTKTKLNEDTQKILQTCQEEVEDLLRKNWEAVEHFAQQLYKKEELDYDEIEAIFNKFGIQKAKNKPSINEKNIFSQKIENE